MHGSKWPINCTRIVDGTELEPELRLVADAWQRAKQVSPCLRASRLDSCITNAHADTRTASSRKKTGGAGLVMPADGEARTTVRVRVDIIGHARIKYVCKYLIFTYFNITN